MRNLVAFVAAVGLLAGCVAGPDATRPSLPVPDHFSAADQWVSTGSGQSPVASDEFWQRFDDPLLARLIEEALVSNHDLRIALARFDKANALLRGAHFDQAPTVTASAGLSDARASFDQVASNPGVDRDVETYELGLASTWELDFFGRVRRNVEANAADLVATTADLRAMQIIVAGEVARSYVGLRGEQERLRVARANASNQRETLRIVEAGLAVGRGTEFDASRARAQLEATLARIPSLEATVAVRMHRLAVLTARMPEALRAELESPDELPRLPDRLDTGTPGEVLRRRPDVVAAEARLAAATARVGVATADLFPRFTLGGLIGTQAIDSSALFEGGSETRLVALGIDWSFLDTGRVRARIAAADADAAATLATYERTVLEALEETENALIVYGRARVEDRHLAQAALDSERAAELARIRFEAGAVNLLEVLDAERTQLEAQDAFADGRARSAAAAVRVYEALAGGWPAKTPVRERVGAR
jgi:NodT family efflux transporter outer membrane factor (OMF) lipoprotein